MSVNVKQNGALTKVGGLYKESTPMSVAEYYSTTEQVIGTWIDGSTLYRKVFTFSTPITCPSQQWAQTDILTSSVNASAMVRAFTALGSSVYVCDVSCDTNETYVTLLNLRSVSITIDTLIIEYTKSS